MVDKPMFDLNKHSEQYPGFWIFRVTGPTEHWITAIEKRVWGLEKKLRKRVFNLQEGDVLIFHASRGTVLPMLGVNESGIIGFGVINKVKVKEEHWWLEELKQDRNIWPLIVFFKSMYLIGNIKDINFSIGVQKKTEFEIVLDSRNILKNKIELVEIDRVLGSKFPVMGSMSGFNNINPRNLLSLITPRVRIHIIAE
jgi:hypothetical protein